MHCRTCKVVGNAPSWALFLLLSLSMLMMAFSVSGIILLVAG